MSEFTPQQIQEIEKIIDSKRTQSFFKLPKSPPHRHDGKDNIKVSSSDIVYPNPVNGTITMSSAKTYTLNLSSVGPAPRKVTFYGGALNTTASPAMHAMIVGEALVGPAKQFQPGTTSSVVTGTVVQNIVQGCGSFIMLNGEGGIGAGASAIIKNSQFHILYAEFPSGTIVASGTVTAINNSQITVAITKLASNWSISGYWSVT